MPAKYRGIEEKHGKFYAYLYYKKKRYTPGKGFKSKVKAHKWRLEKRRELENGINIVDPKITVKEYLKLYLKDYLVPRIKENKIKEASVNTIESAFRNVIVPMLGSYRLNDLSPKILQDFKNELLMKYSAYHIKNIIIEFKRALKIAVTSAMTLSCFPPPTRCSSIRSSRFTDLQNASQNLGSRAASAM